MSSPKRAKYGNKEEVNNESEFIKFLQAVNVLQDDLQVMSKNNDLEVIKLERKLEIERKPLYEKREEAISNIPNFWVTALMNHPDISGILDDSEEEYLLYLSKLEVQHTGEDSVCDFKIMFHFKENPYFKNSTLVKEYSINECDGQQLKKVSGSPILWKDGHDLSQKLKAHKSFLFWLTSQEFGQSDYDIALVIKEDLWVNPLPYYLLSDIEQEDNSDEDEDSEDDVLIIEDSDDEKSMQAEPEDEESDESDEYDSQASSEIAQNEN